MSKKFILKTIINHLYFRPFESTTKKSDGVFYSYGYVLVMCCIDKLNLQLPFLRCHAPCGPLPAFDNSLGESSQAQFITSGSVYSSGNINASLAGTFGTYDSYGLENKPYIGVQGDFDIISGECRDCFGGSSWIPLAIIDLSLSMVRETLFFPYTVAYYFDESNPAKKNNEAIGSSKTSERQNFKSQYKVVECLPP